LVPAAAGVPTHLQYHIPDSIVQQVREAVAPEDIDVRTRKQLYAGISRSVQRAEAFIPGPVLARWSEDRKSAAGTFTFLKAWVEDPSFGTLTVEERHRRASETFSKVSYEWVTMADLLTRYHAHPDREGYVEKLIRAARTKAHPQHPRDPEMKLYRVLQKMSEGGKAPPFFPFKFFPVRESPALPVRPLPHP
jgi:hypothetical protein